MALFGLIPEITSEVTLKMSPEEAKTEAVGKALGLIGTTIGVVGTFMALSVNPAVKAQTTGAWSKLPKGIQENKTGVILFGAVGGAILLAYLIKSSSAKNLASRFK